MSFPKRAILAVSALVVAVLLVALIIAPSGSGQNVEASASPTTVSTTTVVRADPAMDAIFKQSVQRTKDEASARRFYAEVERQRIEKEAADAQAAQVARDAANARAAAARHAAPRASTPARGTSSAPRSAPRSAPAAEVGNGRCGGNLPPCRIMNRESGGNIRAENPTSSASGKWQFLSGTWNGYGGYSSAGQAPESVQDQKAAELWNNGKGCSHWSACGGR